MITTTAFCEILPKAPQAEGWMLLFRKLLKWSKMFQKLWILSAVIFHFKKSLTFPFFTQKYKSLNKSIKLGNNIIREFTFFQILVPLQQHETFTEKRKRGGKKQKLPWKVPDESPWAQNHVGFLHPYWWCSGLKNIKRIISNQDSPFVFEPSTLLGEALYKILFFEDKSLKLGQEVKVQSCFF